MAESQNIDMERILARRISEMDMRLCQCAGR